MAVALSPVYGAGAQFFDDNGDPLAGGFLYTFYAGTTASAKTYTSSSGLVENTNPIELDAAGRPVGNPEIWLTVGTAYKFVLKNSTYVEIWTQDNITIWTPPDLTASLANSTNPALGDAMVAFRQSNSAGILPGAIAKTVHDKLQEFVSVKDFGAVGDGVTPDGDAIVAACASGRQVYFPAGTYLVDAPITIGSLTNFEWRGAGRDASVIKFDDNTNWNSIGLTFDACSSFRITDLGFDQTDAVFQDGGTSYAAIQINGNSGDSNNFSVDNCKFMQSYFIGLSIWKATKFVIDNNWFYRAASALDTGRHYCLNVSCELTLQTGTITRDGVISNNRLYNSGMSVAGWSIVITGNVCEGGTYGAGIATYDKPVDDVDRDNSWIIGAYNVHNNICSGGTGVDADGFEVCGMEIGGPYSVCTGNICHTNAGQGIRWFSYQGVCANNLCYNNGTAGGASYGAYTMAGITAYITNTTPPAPTRELYSCRYSLIANNICFDTGGGDQLYGYSENTPVNYELVGLTVTGNKVTENATGTGYLINSAANNSYDFDQWDTYTPTVTSSTGTITELNSVSGRYSRRGGVVFVKIFIDIKTNGTGAGYLNVSLPLATINDGSIGPACFVGWTASSSGTLTGYAIQNSSTMKLYKYDGSYPGGSGVYLVVNGWYTSSTNA